MAIVQSLNPERDAAIVADRVAGLSYAALGEKYGLAYDSMRLLIRKAAERGDASREALGLRKRRETKPRESVPLRDRIMAKVVVNDETGCWEFQGGTAGKFGYGSVYLESGRWMAAHRAMWMLENGRRPTRWEFICHRCDNPKCCNPAHLFLGTLADNNRDMANKGRYNHQQRTHCIHGHEFTPENTYVAPSKPNKRACRACARELQAMTPEQRAARKLYDGSVRRGERKPGGLPRPRLVNSPETRYGVVTLGGKRSSKITASDK